MVSQVKKISIFVSSPGDLTAEREIVQEVCNEIELDHGRTDGFVIEVIRWETHTRPSAGASAQSTINDQLGTDYDIYLGILGARFGSPTKEWRSGTEEELEIAIANNRIFGAPEIMFYFNDRELPLSQIDPEDLLNRNSLRTRIENEGILHFSFSDATQFRVLLHRHLPPTIRKIGTKNPDRGTTAIPRMQEILVDPLATWNNLLAEDPLCSATELLFAASDDLDQFNKESQKLTEEMKRIASKLRKSAKSMEDANSRGNIAQALRAVNDTTSNTNHYKDSLLRILPRMSGLLDSSLTKCQRSITIAKEANLFNTIGFKGNSDVFLQLRHSISQIIPILKNTSSSFQSWPDEVTELRLLKSKLTALHQDFILFLERSAETLSSIESSLKEGD